MSWQQRALEAVERAGREELLAPLAANLALYRAGRPARTPWYPESYGAGADDG